MEQLSWQGERAEAQDARSSGSLLGGRTKGTHSYLEIARAKLSCVSEVLYTARTRLLSYAFRRSAHALLSILIGILCVCCSCHVLAQHRDAARNEQHGLLAATLADYVGIAQALRQLP